MAKAVTWKIPDSETRKLGEQTGLDTPVVLALNDVRWMLETLGFQCRSQRGKRTAWGVRPQG